MSHGLLKIYKSNGKKSGVFPVQDRVCTLGSAPGSDVRLLMPNVRKSHAKISIDEAGLAVLQCLNTEMNLYVNDVPLVNRQKTTLNHSDRIKVNGRMMRWEYPKAGSASKIPRLTPRNSATKGPVTNFLNKPEHNVVKSLRASFDTSRGSDKKQVSFGPHLSPEQFDKALPPSTPLKRGGKPTTSFLEMVPEKNENTRPSGSEVALSSGTFPYGKAIKGAACKGSTLPKAEMKKARVHRKSCGTPSLYNRAKVQNNMRRKSTSSLQVLNKVKILTAAKTPLKAKKCLVKSPKYLNSPKRKSPTQSGVKLNRSMEARSAGKSLDMSEYTSPNITTDIFVSPLSNTTNSDSLQSLTKSKSIRTKNVGLNITADNIDDTLDVSGVGRLSSTPKVKSEISDLGYIDDVLDEVKHDVTCGLSKSGKTVGVGHLEKGKENESPVRPDESDKSSAVAPGPSERVEDVTGREGSPVRGPQPSVTPTSSKSLSQRMQDTFGARRQFSNISFLSRRSAVTSKSVSTDETGGKSKSGLVGKSVSRDRRSLPNKSGSAAVGVTSMKKNKSLHNITAQGMKKSVSTYSLSVKESKNIRRHSCNPGLKVDPQLKVSIKRLGTPNPRLSSSYLVSKMNSLKKSPGLVQSKVIQENSSGKKSASKITNGKSESANRSLASPKLNTSRQKRAGPGGLKVSPKSGASPTPSDSVEDSHEGTFTIDDSEPSPRPVNEPNRSPGKVAVTPDSKTVADSVVGSERTVSPSDSVTGGDFEEMFPSPSDKSNYRAAGEDPGEPGPQSPGMSLLPSDSRRGTPANNSALKMNADVVNVGPNHNSNESFTPRKNSTKSPLFSPRASRTRSRVSDEESPCPLSSIEDIAGDAAELFRTPIDVKRKVESNSRSGRKSKSSRKDPEVPARLSSRGDDSIAKKNERSVSKLSSEDSLTDVSGLEDLASLFRSPGTPESSEESSVSKIKERSSVPSKVMDCEGETGTPTSVRKRARMTGRSIGSVSSTELSGNSSGINDCRSDSAQFLSGPTTIATSGRKSRPSRVGMATPETSASLETRRSLRGRSKCRMSTTGESVSPDKATRSPQVVSNEAVASDSEHQTIEPNTLSIQSENHSLTAELGDKPVKTPDLPQSYTSPVQSTVRKESLINARRSGLVGDLRPRQSPLAPKKTRGRKTGSLNASVDILDSESFSEGLQSLFRSPVSVDESTLSAISETRAQARRKSKSMDKSSPACAPINSSVNVLSFEPVDTSSIVETGSTSKLINKSVSAPVPVEEVVQECSTPTSPTKVQLSKSPRKSALADNNNPTSVKVSPRESRSGSVAVVRPQRASPSESLLKSTKSSQKEKHFSDMSDGEDVCGDLVALFKTPVSQKSETKPVSKNARGKKSLATGNVSACEDLSDELKSLFQTPDAANRKLSSRLNSELQEKSHKKSSRKSSDLDFSLDPPEALDTSASNKVAGRSKNSKQFVDSPMSTDTSASQCTPEAPFDARHLKLLRKSLPANKSDHVEAYPRRSRSSVVGVVKPQVVSKPGTPLNVIDTQTSRKIKSPGLSSDAVDVSEQLASMFQTPGISTSPSKKEVLESVSIVSPSTESSGETLMPPATKLNSPIATVTDNTSFSDVSEELRFMFTTPKVKTSRKSVNISESLKKVPRTPVASLKLESEEGIPSAKRSTRKHKFNEKVVSPAAKTSAPPSGLKGRRDKKLKSPQDVDDDASQSAVTGLESPESLHEEMESKVGHDHDAVKAVTSIALPDVISASSASRKLTRKRGSPKSGSSVAGKKTRSGVDCRRENEDESHSDVELIQVPVVGSAEESGPPGKSDKAVLNVTPDGPTRRNALSSAKRRKLYTPSADMDLYESINETRDRNSRNGVGSRLSATSPSDVYLESVSAREVKSGTALVALGRRKRKVQPHEVVENGVINEAESLDTVPTKETQKSRATRSRVKRLSIKTNVRRISGNILARATRATRQRAKAVVEEVPEKQEECSDEPARVALKDEMLTLNEVRAEKPTRGKSKVRAVKDVDADNQLSTSPPIIQTRTRSRSTRKTESTSRQDSRSTRRTKKDEFSIVVTSDGDVIQAADLAQHDKPVSPVVKGSSGTEAAPRSTRSRRAKGVSDKEMGSTDVPISADKVVKSGKRGGRRKKQVTFADRCGSSPDKENEDTQIKTNALTKSTKKAPSKTSRVNDKSPSPLMVRVTRSRARL